MRAVLVHAFDRVNDKELFLTVWVMRNCSWFMYLTVWGMRNCS
jgi:hypothetical protein